VCDLHFTFTQGYVELPEGECFLKQVFTGQMSFCQASKLQHQTVKENMLPTRLGQSVNQFLIFIELHLHKEKQCATAKIVNLLIS